MAVDRVDGEGAGPDAGLFALGEVGALEVAFGGGLLAVGGDGLALGGRGERVGERMLGRDDHEGGAEEGVGAGGENLEVAEGGVFEGEEDLRAFAAADPGLLHALGGIGPVHELEVGEQTLGVGGDAQHPLAQRAALDRVFADLGEAVDDLFVGEHGAEGGAPPDGFFLHVGEAALEEFEPDPLGPAEVARVGGVHLALEVVGDADGLQLTAEGGDIFDRNFARVAAGFDRVVFGGQAKGVPADGVEHVFALGALVAGEDVGDGVVLAVAEVQARARRIREHVEHVVFGLRRIDGGGAEGGGVRPEFLPVGLDLEEVVVGAVRGHGKSGKGRSEARMRAEGQGRLPGIRGFAPGAAWRAWKISPRVAGRAGRRGPRRGG